MCRRDRPSTEIMCLLVDRPWSNYFCCVVVANKSFLDRYPVATKRAVRAILKATDLCAADPERAARALVDRGFTREYDYALKTMKEVNYNRWREYDPEDTRSGFARSGWSRTALRSSSPRAPTGDFSKS